MGDVIRYVVDTYIHRTDRAEEAADLPRLLAVLEARFTDGDDPVRELLSDSFVENLPCSWGEATDESRGAEGIHGLLGPALKDLAAKR